MKAVLIEVGSCAWQPLKELLSAFREPCALESSFEGVAADFSKAARVEAAGKLVGNHFNLLQDVCNPRGSLNIDDVPLTQTELIRVSAASARYVDEGLREVARRLLGRSKPDSLSSTKEAEEARAACARYLATRIQSAEAHKPGRTPDMGEEAAAVMKAVLNEVASGASKPRVDVHCAHSNALAAGLESLALQLRATGELTQGQANEFGAMMTDVANRESDRDSIVRRRNSIDSRRSRTEPDLGSLRAPEQKGSGMCTLL